MIAADRVSEARQASVAVPVHAVTAWGPASLSNLGPGFDSLGLCIGELGDRVTAIPTSIAGVTVECDMPLPCDSHLNTAGHAAQCVLEAVDADRGIHLSIEKGIPVGSGIGGSAASAAAGAWATNAVLGFPLSKEDLVEAVLAGESVASGGARHGDNALPALLGGMVMTSPTDPADYRLVQLPRPLYLALLLPQLTIKTSEARTMLPEHVPLRAAVENASDLAFMLHALSAGDYESVGKYMMRDRLVEPVRSKRLCCYDAVRTSAVATGAWACVISGSGPAMVSLCKDFIAAQRVLTAMSSAATLAGVQSSGVVTEPDSYGVRVA